MFLHTGRISVFDLGWDFHFSDPAFLAIYGPMIYTAPYVMVLKQADPLREQVGSGWALEIKTFLGPVELHQSVRRVPFRAQKSRDQDPAPAPILKLGKAKSKGKGGCTNLFELTVEKN